LADGHTSEHADQIAILAHAGLDVCEGRHPTDVMKKAKVPKQQLSQENDYSLAEWVLSVMAIFRQLHGFGIM
jgi:hypothetical protein